MAQKKNIICKKCGEECGHHKHGMNSRGSRGEVVYGLGFIGALVYFIQNADGFWNGVLGVLEAIVWPAVLIYKALASLFGA